MEAALAQLEALAFALFNTTDPNERTHVELSLRGFSSSSEFIPQCQLILDNSKSEFALLLASNSLIKLFSKFYSTFSKDQTVDIRNYILNYLATNCGILPIFVTKSLVQLLCRVARLAWNDDPSHRELVSEVSKFLQHNSMHFKLGLNILSELVQEMNSPASIPAHRKTATSFRDIALLNVFQISLNTLQQFQTSGATTPSWMPSPGLEKQSLLVAAMEITLKALSFDYIGTSPEDSADDAGTIQVPASWRSLIEEPATLRLYMDIFLASAQTQQTEAMSLSMQCLAQLASVRRSLFSSDEKRVQFLTGLISITVEVIKLPQLLLQDSSHDSYLHFCRLLSRLKANYQLTELVKLDLYPEWINAVATFTDSSFGNYVMQWVENGVHYLLGLWSRLTVSIPFMKGDTPTYLQGLVPKIFTKFVSMRIDAIRQNVNEDDIDAIFDVLELEEQMRNLPTLARLHYPDAVRVVIGLFDPIVEGYQSATESSNLSFIRLYEVQLAWLVSLIAALIGSSPLPGSDADAQEACDAEIVFRVLRLTKIVDFRQTGQSAIPVSPHLALAFIHFFSDFRRQYIGNSEHGSRGMHVHQRDMDLVDGDESSIGNRQLEQKDPPIYARLSILLGHVNQTLLLSSIINRIITDLRYFSSNSTVIKECLLLLADLSSGYTSSKMLMTLDNATAMLTNHGSGTFPFLALQSNFKARTTFYLTLGRLVFSESNIELFEPFMEPFSSALSLLASQPDMRSEFSISIGVGLCRDLRGVVQATCNKKSYALLFEWLFPARWHVLLRLVENCWDLPSVVVPFFRFLAELVLNKSQRITFDICSPNGLLLFKEASKCLEVYGTRILSVADAPVSDIYKDRYKPMSLCLLILQRALSGAYCPFGVFALYNDSALSVGLDVSIKMILFIRNNYESYPKVSKIYYSTLEILFRNHLTMLAELDTRVFRFFINSLHDGLQHHEAAVSSISATSLDYLFSLYWRLSRKREPDSACQSLGKHLAENADMCQNILNTMFNLVVFENVSHHWALGRTIFSLILCIESTFAVYKGLLLQTQPRELHAPLETAFVQLMTGIQPSLEPTHRDKFTQNLAAFKAAMGRLLLRPNIQ